MAKFKKGDKVRCVAQKSGVGWIKNREFVACRISLENTNTPVYWGSKGSGGYEEGLELVEQTYTKLTPKVGDKFRVTKLKKHGSNPFRVGECITLVSDEGGCEKRWRGNNDVELWHHDSDGNSVITTEYLEPVEEELPVNRHVDVPKLTSALKRALSADKQTLFKDEVIGQNLTLTTRGQSMYISALFDNDGDHKKAMEQLVADAQESLDEEKN